MNNLRQTRLIIYKLKRAYGVSVHILTNESMTQDLKTGIIDRQEELIVVRRAIIITPKMSREFAYDLAFIAANKNFTYGGYFDTSKRIMIIDTKDVPSTYSPSLNDCCVYDGARWQFEELDKITGNTAHYILLRSITNQPTEDQHIKSVDQPIILTEETNPWLS